MPKENTTEKISIQAEDFSLIDELDWLERDNVKDGATVNFCGRVRQKNLNQTVSGLFLEHYPSMTEKTISDIIVKARAQWHISRISVIHRIGQLAIGEQIVFVGVTSPHRKDAYAANEFIMDFLKVDAPFWKKETTDQGEKWLNAKQSDQEKAAQWFASKVDNK